MWRFHSRLLETKMYRNYLKWHNKILNLNCNLHLIISNHNRARTYCTVCVGLNNLGLHTHTRWKNCHSGSLFLSCDTATNISISDALYRHPSLKSWQWSGCSRDITFGRSAIPRMTFNAVSRLFTLKCSIRHGNSQSPYLHMMVVATAKAAVLAMALVVPRL